MSRFAVVLMMLATSLALGCGEAPAENNDVEEQGRRQLVINNNTAVGACSYWCINSVPECFTTCNVANTNDVAGCKSCCDDQCIGDQIKVLCRHACETDSEHLDYGLQCLRQHGSDSLLTCIDCCQDAVSVVR